MTKPKTQILKDVELNAAYATLSEQNYDAIELAFITTAKALTLDDLNKGIKLGDILDMMQTNIDNLRTYHDDLELFEYERLIDETIWNTYHDKLVEKFSLEFDSLENEMLKNPIIKSRGLKVNDEVLSIMEHANITFIKEKMQQKEIEV